MQNQLIGHDFSSQVKLNLLPHVSVARGMLRVRIDWIEHNQSANTTEFNSTEYNTDNGPGLDIIVGRDVHSITFSVFRHNSFPSGPKVNYRCSIRIDRLILLNMAVKLINFQDKTTK